VLMGLSRVLDNDIGVAIYESVMTEKDPDQRVDNGDVTGTS
jgi:hypothetical protein